ncbi:MAG: helix-turn-helix domain-containing protein [Candidatus Omnitrophota bacterium]
MTDARMTITEAADLIGVTAKTIMRWEQAGKVQKAKRDWRGWRFYTQEDLENLKTFKECIVYSREA